MTETVESELHIFRSPKLQSVVNDAITFFSTTPVYRLPPPQFTGIGVYGLYYFGEYELYAKISNLNRDVCTQPIYVGKAVPEGWRTARSSVLITKKLYNRLREHAKSISQATNLEIDDFQCRFMMFDGIERDLIVPVEAELIRRFKPLWNSAVDGFGNHDPGAGRYNQAPSEWDILHPGRIWVTRLTGSSPLLERVTAKVERFLEQSPFS